MEGVSEMSCNTCDEPCVSNEGEILLKCNPIKCQFWTPKIKRQHIIFEIIIEE